MMDDSISRQAAIATAISGMTREIDGEKWIRVSEVRESIKTLQPAQPEQKTGKWIRWMETTEDKYGMEYNPHCKCSECGTEYVPHFTQFVKYCYRCGAKMDETVRIEE